MAIAKLIKKLRLNSTRCHLLSSPLSLSRDEVEALHKLVMHISKKYGIEVDVASVPSYCVEELRAHGYFERYRRLSALVQHLHSVFSERKKNAKIAVSIGTVVLMISSLYSYTLLSSGVIDKIIARGVNALPVLVLLISTIGALIVAVALIWRSIEVLRVQTVDASQDLRLGIEEMRELLDEASEELKNCILESVI